MDDCLLKLQAAARTICVLIRNFALLAALSVTVGGASVWAASPPPPAGSTPGGAMPQISDKPEPFVYPVIQSQPFSDDASGIDDQITDDTKAPRMLVKGFEIFGVKDHPLHGINLENIQQLINAEITSMLPEDKPRLFTLSMFERVANVITSYYRQRGFFLARAYIPEQKINNGIVKLQVVESYLQQVSFDGNQLYDDATMAILFDHLIDKPVYITDIESALFKLNNYPGLNATAVFGPGTKPGSAAIVMITEEVSTYDYLSLDNYGSAFTGENRLLYRHINNNLFGNADLLAFNLMTSVFPADTQYLDIHYVQPVFRSMFRVGGGVKFNTFNVGEDLGDLDINGDSLILNGFIDFDIIRTKLDQFSLLADLSLKTATSKIGSTVSSEDKLTVIQIGARYAGIDRWLWRANHELSFTVSTGLPDLLGSMDELGSGLSSRRNTAGQLAGGDFSKINLSYTRHQPTVKLQSLLIRLQAQVSSDQLTSLEQFSLGGPNNVRAYPASEVLFDNATFASFEYILRASPEIKMTWLNRLQISAYFDYATGDLNQPLVNEQSAATLSGLGVGIQIEPFNKLRVRVDMSTDLGDKPSELQSLPFYLSLEYKFD